MLILSVSRLDNAVIYIGNSDNVWHVDCLGIITVCT